MVSTDENKNGITDETRTADSVVSADAPTGDSEKTDFEALYEETFDKRISPGSLVTGTVVQIGTDYIMIDIGRKIDGQVPIDEFLDTDGTLTCSVGQDVEVLVESINTTKGVIKLSKRKAERLKVWDEVIKASQENTYLSGRVKERIKGGLIVDIGLDAFLPTSQATLGPATETDLEAMIGRVIDVSVIKFNRKKNNVVVSHREVLEKQREENKKRLLATLAKGDVVTGRVKNIMS
ncbi:MAG TPA: S1 RNA-binding domain-containing protein, partial [Deltaproteobacteria bacterium]|nr:S1 RNA-binding domain-containing protein [Deltaproteobacteria bacterium]